MWVRGPLAAPLPYKGKIEKEKGMAKKGIEVFILLDRSGSMATLWEEAVGSINAYVDELLKDKANDTITLATFDSYPYPIGSFDVIRDAVSIKKWEKFTGEGVEPRGMTPLYDSFSKIVTMATEKGSKKTAIVVMTDGYENASREVNIETVKALVKRVEDKKWQLNFLGANFDTKAQANALGVNGGVVMNFVNLHAGEALVSTAHTHSAYRGSAQSVCYTAEDRLAAGEDEVSSN